MNKIASPSAPATAAVGDPAGAAIVNKVRVVLVTGMSGAGKSSVLKALEDLGYEAVDNLPFSLLAHLVRAGQEQHRPLAIGADIRTRDFQVADVLTQIDELRADPALELRILFLDCDEDVLQRRYTQTRRRHPLALDLPLIDGIRLERQILSPFAERAQRIIDTTDLSETDLRRSIFDQFSPETDAKLVIGVVSFAFRHGLPREADMVFDVRFLRNPHYVPVLQPFSGQDATIGNYISADSAFEPFMNGLKSLLAPLLPRFQQEGKSYLTIAIGCTGGRHRSVFIAERLADWLEKQGNSVRLRHRDIARQTPAPAS